MQTSYLEAPQDRVPSRGRRRRCAPLLMVLLDPSKILILVFFPPELSRAAKWRKKCIRHPVPPVNTGFGKWGKGRKKRV